ncbi:hypothetical protein Lcho_2239 [Leptothrix cholodnii SP-6]|uniref:Uncharacterized protein n=1 Tax=Leptothrix cholodnii (strain ATCC 51168 / LMG 8142 / SP-6) TaxID=395495 RepID=B1Y3H7_LEPCP|nr:hypothetical protein [Leptothrix cholodnii]ACB34505.1 hypothetical protein Lcho_2239 [Leptothrix cholodnii SP-6]
MDKRIAPVIDAETGKVIELNPPCGGSWLRDADGGLTPGDAATAKAAGLQWGDAPAEPDPEIVPDLVPRKTGR